MTRRKFDQITTIISILIVLIFALLSTTSCSREIRTDDITVKRYQTTFKSIHHYRTGNTSAYP